DPGPRRRPLVVLLVRGRARSAARAPATRDGAAGGALPAARADGVRLLQRHLAHRRRVTADAGRRILAIDTATRRCSVAWTRDGVVLGERSEATSSNHAGTLPRLVGEALS